MKSSALTQFSYKDFTGRSFLNDLTELTKLKDKKNHSIDQLDNVTELILKVVFILVKEYDNKYNTSQITNYENLLSQIDNLYDNTEWIYQVLDLACSPISRQLQVTK